MRDKIITLVAALAVGTWGLMGCEEFDQPPADGPQQDRQPAEPTDEPGRPGANDPLGAPGDAGDDDYGTSPGAFDGLGDDTGSAGDDDLAPPPAPQE